MGGLFDPDFFDKQAIKDRINRSVQQNKRGAPPSSDLAGAVVGLLLIFLVVLPLSVARRLGPLAWRVLRRAVARLTNRDRPN
jgi:hypothetical protein